MSLILDEVERTMVNADPLVDLKLVLADFALPSILRLRNALDRGKMITHCYLNTRGMGCIMYWLSGVTTKAELLAYPFSTEEIWWAARRVVRWFDNGRLTLAMIQSTIEEEVEKRQAVRFEAPVAELVEV